MKMLSTTEQSINIKTYIEYFEMVYFFKLFKFGDSFDKEISDENLRLLGLWKYFNLKIYRLMYLQNINTSITKKNIPV